MVRRLSWLARLTVGGALVGLTPAQAVAAAPLTLDEVLEAVARTHPQIEEAEQQVKQFEAEALAARGAFDPVLSSRALWNPVGYYRNGQLDAVVTQPTPIWGLSFYGGYRLGWGDYPIYKRELETHSAGELRAGIVAPLWRDGWTDARRAGVERARLRERFARRTQNMTELELAAAAAHAYWNWVAEGQRLDVVRELLAVAERRQADFADQAEAGAIEPITLVDNRRLVLERAAKAVAAERKFQQAALKLSLFLRDRDETPVVPGEDRVPARFPKPELIDLPSLTQAIEQALRRRPDMAALRAQAEAAQVDVRLAKNQRAPSVDVETFVAKDIGEGAVDLEPTEWGVGATFEMPILLRTERGQLNAARAKAAQIDARMRGIRDRIQVEVRSQYVALRAAANTAALAVAQLEAAVELAEAERFRMRQGLSDLLVVNLREIAAADAELEAISAMAEYQQARADYLIAAGQSPVGYAMRPGP